ncbi:MULTISPECIES: adenosylmethionine--8-amino-7-oxononanoate transaminase [unclassified Fibrobacter]|uniref:adenosylmethionine--8-amino-7-oxononanoate transaminase n=1 Tax=unclassified Fibrobacter TaxID=2634177 RepID=UPI000D6D53CB|nr:MULTISPECIES: adenosylmethionine--8-amino-7-oxononanoate transaminase [unclassified Fibrobacter]PWJ61475.1 adenosylmethionine-8-amino-7-oxononanoate aminotransferase [Fibrobacter sp. UWR4]PZW67291.1 adenosylmethionine-8-amino-7-oxononanoate aminotransferase [Fibrobacter sp. UWR1]
MTNTNSLLAFDAEHLWHPYAALKNTPARFLAKSAQGTKIRTADGLELIDAVSSWWCVAHGHNAPEITEAIRKQSEKLSHVMFGGFTHEPAIELGEKLVKFLPKGLNKIFYADSGSIAVECAAKMAVQYQFALGKPERCKLVALKGGYHGDTAGAMALSDPDGMHTLFRGIMPQHYFAERPNCRADGEWDDRDFVSMEQVVNQHENEIAAVICEPVFQGGNGMWLYNAGYLKRLRKLCDEKGILLIFDEIAAGFYRTGPKWGMDHTKSADGNCDGILPDIMTIGKALTGGHITMAACVASEKVADTITNSKISAFMHGPTYMANPLACAAGIASLNLFESRDYAKNVARIESRLRANLEPLRNLENAADVRVLGAIGCLELKAIPTSDDILRVIRKTGVWLRPFCNYVYTMPPLITSDAEIDQICEAIKMIGQCEPGPVNDDEFHE